MKLFTTGLGIVLLGALSISLAQCFLLHDPAVARILLYVGLSFLGLALILAVLIPLLPRRWKL